MTEAGGRDVFEVHLHTGQSYPLPRHFIVAVADGGTKRRSGGFEVFHIVAVPDDVHGVHIEKLTSISKLWRQ